MVTEIAAASAELLKLVNNQASTAQQRRLDALQTEATDDVATFKDALLDRNRERVNLMLDGLQHGILVQLTEDESRELCGLTPVIDSATLLGLYARARYGDLAASLSALASSSTDSH